MKVDNPTGWPHWIKPPKMLSHVFVMSFYSLTLGNTFLGYKCQQHHQSFSLIFNKTFIWLLIEFWKLKGTMKCNIKAESLKLTGENWNYETFEHLQVTIRGHLWLVCRFRKMDQFWPGKILAHHKFFKFWRIKNL